MPSFFQPEERRKDPRRLFFFFPAGANKLALIFFYHFPINRLVFPEEPDPENQWPVFLLARPPWGVKHFSWPVLSVDFFDVAPFDQ